MLQHTCRVWERYIGVKPRPRSGLTRISQNSCGSGSRFHSIAVAVSMTRVTGLVWLAPLAGIFVSLAHWYARFRNTHGKAGVIECATIFVLSTVATVGLIIAGWASRNPFDYTSGAYVVLLTYGGSALAIYCLVAASLILLITTRGSASRRARAVAGILMASSTVLTAAVVVPFLLA